MKTRHVCVVVVLTTLLAVAAIAQKIPTATLTGHVTDGKLPLPGVTVTVTSPNLQGARTATSTVNSDYILELLPSGFYTVKFEIAGFETVDTTVKLSGDLTSRVDAVMAQAAKLAEQVTVTGRYDTVSATATASTTQEASLIQVLPVSRDALSYLSLAPATVQLLGAHPYQQIAGAVSFESLYLLNGAPNMDTVTGMFLALYIEDAIQETTTSLSNISAEYGRFTGGVVNVLTKSGGNEFHGSVRLNLTNPRWTAPTPVTEERADELGKVWEGTLGGYLFKDRLWFFLGGRTTSQTTSLQSYPPVSIPFDQTERQNRYEGKLTLALSSSHRLVGSYLDVRDDWTNWYYPTPIYDLATLSSESVPMDIKVLNYNGVLSDTFFLEAQYSYRKKQWLGQGSRYTDIERGTPVWDDSTGTLFNSPIFCAVCGGTPDKRENSDAFVKASWFLSTANAGSHDLRVGADLFDDMRKADNWQSGSGYFLDAISVNIVGTGTSAQYYPVILPNYSYIEYYPISQLSQGNHFKTESAFANDVWRLNGHFTFNIGVRFDKNDGTDESGTKVVRDSKWSPRLSLTWDPKGDGKTQVLLGYAQYVAGMNNAVGDQQAKSGWAANYYLLYEGSPINASGNQVQTHEALQEVFNWLSSIGGLLANPQLLIGEYVPGYQTFIGSDLRSPSTTQWTLGVTERLGTRGLVRLDLLDKTWTDLYSERVDMTTGHSEDTFGNLYDRIIIGNDPHARRRYQALILQGDYRAGERWRLGGNYTLSRLYGNDCGYSTACMNGLDYYPEYWQLKWYAPEGYLSGDQRHKLNLYASWDAVSTKITALNVSVLQRVVSGAPYGAWGYVRVGQYANNPGYATPPMFEYYALTAPDAYRLGTVTSTDIAATLTFKVGKGIELYVNPQIQNVFNNRAAINVDSTVYTNYNLPHSLALFNPFTTKPVECPQNDTPAQCSAMGANWKKGPNFGTPVLPTYYQTPRTFLVNVGMRF